MEEMDRRLLDLAMTDPAVHQALRLVERGLSLEEALTELAVMQSKSIAELKERLIWYAERHPGPSPLEKQVRQQLRPEIDQQH